MYRSPISSKEEKKLFISFRNKNYWGLGRCLCWWTALPCKHEEPSRDLLKLNSLASQASQSLSSGIGECSCLKRYNGEQQWKTSTLASGLHIHKQVCVCLNEHKLTHINTPHKCIMYTCTHKHKSTKDHEVSGYGIFDIQKDSQRYMGRIFSIAAHYPYTLECSLADVN